MQSTSMQMVSKPQSPSPQTARITLELSVGLGMATYYSNGLNAQAAFYEGELPQARNAAQACIDQGVKFIVYSVLVDYPGEKSVPHFHVKNQGASAVGTEYASRETFRFVPILHSYKHHTADTNTVMDYIKGKGVPAAFINTCQYFSDILKYDLVKKNDDGSFSLWQMMPDDTKIDSFAVEQTGDWVKAILENPDKYKGKSQFLATLYEPRLNGVSPRES